MNFPIILSDVHVHIRSCFHAPTVLQEATNNFRRIASQFCGNEKFAGVLCLTTAPNDRGISYLLNCLLKEQDKHNEFLSGVSLIETQEHESFCLSLHDGSVLVVIAGRQVVSAEDLEVLAIGTRVEFDAKTRTDRLIEEIARVGAIPVVPWGVGKWIGRRGRLVGELIQNVQLPQFCLGDNGNRPVFWSPPAHFRRAKEEGINILSGTDALPFPEEAQRIGSFGVALKGSLDVEKPARDLKEKLLDSSTVLHQFGSKATPLRFVRNQLKMQFRKLVR